MPIRPENKHRYPPDWKHIREKILERAQHKCERCHVPNHAIGIRDHTGDFHQLDSASLEPLAASVDGHKVIRIVLTIAHLNHQPENNRPSNLRALCQRCHNQHDAPHRAKNRARRRARQMQAAGAQPLFGNESTQEP